MLSHFKARIRTFAAAAAASEAANVTGHKHELAGGLRVAGNSLDECRVFIADCCRRLALPVNVRAAVYRVHEELISANSGKLTRRSEFSAACIFLGCRLMNCPRTMREICNVCSVSTRETGRIYKKLIKDRKFEFPITSADQFVQRIGSDLDLDEATVGVASEYLRQLTENPSSYGRRPASLAASALYMACSVHNTKVKVSDICSAVDVSPTTVKLIAGELLAKQDLLPPNDAKGRS